MTLPRFAILILVTLSFGVPRVVHAADAANLPSNPPVATSGTSGNATASPAKASKDYVLHLGDTIGVDVADDPKASHDYKISRDGTVLPTYLTVPVKLAGLSVVSATKILAQAYTESKIFPNPHITILIKDYAPQRINFLGQVGRPGWIIIPPEEQLTLVTAFADAGGHTPKASRYCTITRLLPDGTTTILKNVDVRAAVEDAKKDIPLQEGDTVFMGESTLGADWQ